MAKTKTPTPPTPPPPPTAPTNSERRLSVLVTIILLFGGALGAWVWVAKIAGAVASWQKPSAVSVTNNDPAVSDVAQTPSRALDGMPVEAGKEFSFPVGVMIENLPEVRPQAGLSSASVVYEALAEGGATRFLAVFPGPGDHLEKIGPVRSVRPYYLEWIAEYGGAIAHAGGSPDALEMVSGFGYPALNGIGSAGKYFQRDRTRAAPHNLFTSSDMLTKALRDMAWDERKPTFTPWRFKDDRALADRPIGEPPVTIKFSGYAFETEYRYIQTSNTYARFNSGQPHEDALTGEQIQAKNVIVQIIPPIVDVGEKGRLTLDVHGSGKALIFVDGGVNVGTWTKTDRTGRTEFFYENGDPAELNRGSTWVAVVPEDKAVDYGVK